MAKVREPEKFIKTADLVELFTGKLTPEYVSRLVEEGKLPAYRFGPKGHLFFRVSEVEKALRVKVEKKPVTEEAAGVVAAR